MMVPNGSDVGTTQGPDAPPMTSDEFADALARLVSDAENVGLQPEVVLAEIEGMAEAMRVCVEE